jgi:hypothetical protein
VRVKTFGYAIDVSEQFLERTENPSRYVNEALVEKVETTELRGPRGGLYQRFGPITVDVDAVEGLGFIRGIRTFTAWTKARYVRPKR